MVVGAVGSAVISTVGGGLTVYCGFPEILPSRRIIYGPACSQSSPILSIVYFVVALFNLVFHSCMWKIAEACLQEPVQPAPSEEATPATNEPPAPSVATRPQQGCSVIECIRFAAVVSALITLQGVVWGWYCTLGTYKTGGKPVYPGGCPGNSAPPALAGIVLSSLSVTSACFGYKYLLSCFGCKPHRRDPQPPG